MRDPTWVIIAIVLVAGLGHAADQTVLGKQLLLKDPKPGIDATKRKLVVQAKESSSPDTIVGDPTAAGATLTVFVSGATSTNQVFVLPAGTDPVSGKPFWSATGGGFKYKDAKGANGAVKIAEIKKSGGGTFSLKVVALGKNGPVSLVPPNPGNSACARLDLAGGNRYHVLLPSPPNATVKKNDAKAFLVKDALVEGLCSLPVCGNGVKEAGEACDGGPFCAPNCVANITSCCVVPGQCVTTPGFSLFVNLIGYCNGVLPPGTFQVIGGGVCQADASCTTEPLAPLSICCQLPDSCNDAVVSDTGTLWSFHNVCQGMFNVTSPGARCVGTICVAP